MTTYFCNVILFLKGPNLPGGNCQEGRMVPMPDGYGAILVGCYQSKDAMYKLFWNGNELEWTTLSDKIQNQRFDTVSMLIPDELANCNE